MSSLRTWFFAVGIVALLAPASRGQAVAFVPIVQSFPNGVTMSATPVVSADRRYVRLTMNPQFTVLEGFDPIQVPAAVTGGGAAGGGGLGGGVAGFAGLNGPMAAPGPEMAGYRFGNPGAGAGLGGAANSPDFGSGDFEDRSWPQGGGALRQRTLGRPVPTKAAKNRRGRVALQRKAGSPAAKGSGLIARDRFSNSSSKSQKK